VKTLFLEKLIFMKKGEISNFIRKTGLLPLADRVRFYMEKYNNRKINSDFLRMNPGIKLPPDYLIYESFQLNYKKYYADSEESARWLTDILKKHVQLKDIRILDWGCGPGRIIRHLGKFTGDGCELHGTDYNAKTISWCSQNLQGIQFNTNQLEAGLPYPDNYFDVIYGISIFTHLSKKMHIEWYNELLRVLKSGGVILLTTQGSNFKAKLTHHEKINFDNGELVVRGNVREGHRTYSAFHPVKFMEKIFEKDIILEHIEYKPRENGWIPQDVWIIKKIEQ
jgi:ubiquinone/menaquinone biosynthesis C-methylase UbiE